MLTRESKRYQAAEEYFTFARKIDPNNHYALVGHALSLFGQNRVNDALPLVEQLAALYPNAPDSHILNALLYNSQDKTIKITNELEAGRKFDELRWNFVFVPKVDELIRNVYHNVFSPAISPAALYPAK